MRDKVWRKLSRKYRKRDAKEVAQWARQRRYIKPAGNNGQKPAATKPITAPLT